jgi:DNA-binding protein H-NS
MAKINLSRMDVQALIDLRKQVEDTLVSQRSTLERQLAALGGSIASMGGKIARDGRGSALKGKKVAPKYRSPDGETWAGRGAKPRWLVAAIKEGKKLEQFLIEKAPPKARKKRRSKR